MTTQLEGMSASIRQLSQGLNAQRQQTGALFEAFNRRLAQVEKALGIHPAALLPQSAPAAVAAPAPAPRPPGAPPAAAPIKNRERLSVPIARPIQARGTTLNGSPPPAPAVVAAPTPGQVLPGVATGDLQALVVGLVQNALGSLVAGLAAPAAEPAAADAPAVLDVPAEPLDGTLQGTPHTPSAADTSWLHEEAAAGGPPVPPIVGEVTTASVSHPR